MTPVVGGNGMSVLAQAAHSATGTTTLRGVPGYQSTIREHYGGGVTEITRKHDSVAVKHDSSCLAALSYLFTFLKHFLYLCCLIAHNEKQKQLLTMDVLALATMKNAVKCDT